jgi:hypothetical protein
MNEPRHGTIVSGEVIPPQTYLHKVAAAKHEDPGDDGTEQNTAAEDRDDTESAGDVHGTYDADDADDDEYPAAMPMASANADTDPAAAHTAAANTARSDTARSDTAGTDAAEPDPAWTGTDATDTTRAVGPRAGILETDAARTTAAPEDTGATGTDPGGADTAVMDATRPGAVATQTSVGAKPREGHPGDVPMPEDASLIGDDAVIREQWMRVQASFVDNPRAAVTAAAGVITDAAAQVETAVRQRQQALRTRWDGGGHADTEALRVTMQQYRQLLERLAAL